MLLDDDIVAQRQAEASAFAGRLGGEEWIEHFFLHLGWDAGAIVANPDLHAVAETLGRCRKRRLVVVTLGLGLAFRRRVKAVGNQVEQHPGDLLRDTDRLARQPDRGMAAM